MSDKEVVDSGDLVVNNDDEDSVGQTIKTIQPTIILSSTDFSIGQYMLSMRVELNNGESDVLGQLTEVGDIFEELEL